MVQEEEEMQGGVWNKGPDELMPADDYFTDRLDGAVKLRLKESNSGERYAPMSIYTMFRRTSEKRPDRAALCYKKGDTWLKFTYKEYFEICHKAAKSFIKVGLQPNACVCIIGFNTPQWFISSIGSIFAS